MYQDQPILDSVRVFDTLIATSLSILRKSITVLRKK
jgi:hypothetical protein